MAGLGRAGLLETYSPERGEFLARRTIDELLATVAGGKPPD